MHTLDFDYTIQDVQEVCQMNGGRLLCKYGVCRVEKRI